MQTRHWIIAVFAAFAGTAADAQTATPRAPASVPTITIPASPPTAAAPVPASAAPSASIAKPAPAVAATPAAQAAAPTAVTAAPVTQPAATAAAAAGSAGGSATPVAAVAAVSRAAVAPITLTDDPQFPHLPILKTPVAFWTKVFSEWSEHQSVMHSTEDLGLIYTVLDFRADAAVLSPGALAALKSREEKQAYFKLNTALSQLQAIQDRDGGINPETLSEDQRRVYDMFGDNTYSKRFSKVMGTFRVQRGLKERTQLALQTSGRYLPEMERIFSGYSLPTKLTRLPLVESSFNVDAYSKAAAAGLWQFIPSSARIYMRLNELVDDRRDPWTSTDAAARHLSDDYTVLGNWPLALTAYNYGRGGLAHALTEVGGSTLTDVIERYNNKRFGFASSNFYAEFLAASDVEREYRRHFGEITREPALAFETVSTRDYVPYATLRKITGADEEEFRRLNPAYRPEVVEGKLYVPPGHTIRVPAGAAQRFQMAYASLTPDQRFDRQRQFYASHVVARGESVGKIARHYGVSTAQLLALNGIANAAKVRAGQTLKVPINDSASNIVAAAIAPLDPAAAETTRAVKVKASTVAAAKAARLGTHRVTAGQTLGAIAKRYQTSIQHLRDLNGFGQSDVLRVGSTIKVPKG